MLKAAKPNQQAKQKQLDIDWLLSIWISTFYP